MLTGYIFFLGRVQISVVTVVTLLGGVNLSQKATSAAPGRKSPRSPDEKIACNSVASEVSTIVSKVTLEDWGGF